MPTRPHAPAPSARAGPGQPGGRARNPRPRRWRRRGHQPPSRPEHDGDEQVLQPTSAPSRDRPPPPNGATRAVRTMKVALVSSVPRGARDRDPEDLVGVPPAGEEQGEVRRVGDLHNARSRTAAITTLWPTRPTRRRRLRGLFVKDDERGDASVMCSPRRPPSRRYAAAQCPAAAFAYCQRGPAGEPLRSRSPRFVIFTTGLGVRRRPWAGPATTS